MWRFASGFLAGCCLLLLQPRLPAPGLLMALAASMVIAGVWCRSRIGPIVALGTACGFAWCGWVAGERLADRLAPELEGRTLRLSGAVASVPQVSDAGLRFRLAPERPSGLPPLIELTWYEPEWRPLAAERLELEVRLRRPRGFANPGGSDNDARMLREGIGASGYVRAATRLGRSREDLWQSPVLATRAAVADAIRNSLGERPATGIVAGLAVGLQDALSREQWLALSRSGTSHLMAISGLHIAMVATMAAWVAAAVQKRRQRQGATGCRRDVAVLTGAVAAALYSALAGWSVPTQRTMLMIAVAALALRLRRRAGVANGLGLCALAVLLLDPVAPLAPGFWLSFGAVAVILFATAGYVVRPGMMRSYLQVQGAVTLGLAPVLIGSFGNVSLVAAFVNLLAIPLYTLVIVPLVLLASGCAMLWQPVGDVLLHAAAWLIEGTWPLIEAPSRWPLATWAVSGASFVAWAALVAGAAAALAPLPAHGRIAGLILVVAGGLWRPASPPPGAARLTVLDVGQGLATVVQTRSHVLVYDTGASFRSGTDAGQLTVVPFLHSRGVRRLDLVAISHADDDHAGGAESIVAAVPTRALATSPDMWLPRWALPTVNRIDRCRRGERWEWDGVEFTWLHPGSEPHETDNDGSCALQVRAGEHVALLTGDIERRAEQEILASGVLGRSDVLVAPHHGSRSSSSEAFVRATEPHWVVFAAGHRNRWGFPSPTVVARWRAAGASTLVTATSGAIEFQLHPGQPLAPPGQWRIDHRRLWMDP